MGDPEYDVCVVGSGAGGAPVAHALAQAGFSVVVLEKGPRYERSDFVHDEIAICRRDFFVPSIEDDPHVVVPEGKRPRRSSMGWIARCVGGGTVHMSGYFYRLHPVDFRMASEFGASEGLSLADWPISYDDLEPWYARVERLIGVSGRAGANRFDPPRSTEYPLPPVRVHPASAFIDRACLGLGYNSFPTPRAIVSEAYQGRSPCLYCDFCGSYGCEVGAKSSTLATLLPMAEATGRCRIEPGAFAVSVEVGAGGRATGCLVRDAGGTERRVRARVVVLACSAVETARLLLLSRSRGHPDGLANSSGLVGRNLQFSSYSGGAGVFRLDRPEEERRILLERHPFVGRSLQDFYRLPSGTASGLDKGGTIRFGFPHPNPIFTALRLARLEGGLAWGATLKRRMRKHWLETRTIEFEAFADFHPNPGTRVELDPDVVDRWGLPAARIHLAVPPVHVRAGEFLQARGLEVLEAAGADEVLPGDVAGVTGHLVHGTCRAGTDPARSVVDRDGRAHDVDNLYVSDGSYFPTSGGVPTTLTILANALRIGEAIAERGRRGDFR